MRQKVRDTRGALLGGDIYILRFDLSYFIVLVFFEFLRFASNLSDFL